MKKVNIFLSNSMVGLLTIGMSLLLAGCLFGRSQIHEMQSGNIIKESKQEETSVLSKEEDEKFVGLFHGVADQGGLNALQQQLLIDFKSYNVPVVAFNREDSEKIGLEQQAQTVYETLKKQAANKGIILMGDSQGGILVALVTLNYGNQLNIKGIITNHSPWEGAPVAGLTEDNFNQFMTHPSVRGIVVMLQIFGVNLKHILKENLDRFTKGQGVTDLQANSAVIQKIKTQLPNIKVPIVAIGGHQINLTDALLILLGFPQFCGNPMFEQLGASLTPAWNQLVGSENHDFLIPTESQLARNTSKGANFKEFPIVGHHHYNPLHQGQVYQNIVIAIKEMFDIK